MNFLIEDIILYNDDDGSILHLSQIDDSPLLLTPVPNRILSLLLANQGNLVTHETFYVQVWDRYGKSGSSNSLKQYIGVIRKILKTHLGKECIVTVAGQGYIFSKDICVNIQAEAPIIEIKSDELMAPSEKVILKSSLEKNKNLYAYLVALFSVLLLIIIMLHRETDRVGSLATLSLKKITYIGSCPVISLSPLIEKETDYYYKDIVSILSVNKSACDKGDIFYYFTNGKNKENEGNSYSILSKCSFDHVKDKCITFRVTR